MLDVGAIAGITWTAEAPVPMIATRLPAQVLVVVPARGVHGDAGEVVDAGDVGRLGVREHAGRVDEEARGDSSPPAVGAGATGRASSSNVAPRRSSVRTGSCARRPYLSTQCSA